MNTESSRYTHDCNNCSYLGRYLSYDLYFCAGKNKTVIARNGSNGNDYESGLQFAFPDSSIPLFEAKKRAIRLGLINSKMKNKKNIYFKVALSDDFDNFYIENNIEGLISAMKQDCKENEEPQGYIITPIEMTIGDYESLEEFTGF